MIDTVDEMVDAGVHVLPTTQALVDAQTRIRDRDVSRAEFRTHARRIFRHLVEAAYGCLPQEPVTVVTPPGHVFTGARTTDRFCAVAVVRAGESLESELLDLAPGVRIGKILIQRDRATALPHLLWSHLPPDVADGHVLLLEPMLATAGSVLAAVDVLEAAGVAEDRVVVVSLLASPPGLARLRRERPEARVVVASIERGLDENAFMIPGIGDFGDRWYGTERVSS